MRHPARIIFVLALAAVGSAPVAQAFGSYFHTLGLGAFPPTFVAVNSAATTTTSPAVTIDAPSGVLAGDLLIASFVVYSRTPPTLPSGWTQRGSVEWVPYDYMSYIFTKTAGGSEPASYSFPIAGDAANGYRGIVVAYRHAVFRSASSLVDTSTLTLTLPSVAGTANGDLAVGLAFDRYFGGPLTGTGGTSRYSDITGAYWSGLVYEVPVTGSSSQTMAISRNASATWSAAGGQVILQGN